MAQAAAKKDDTVQSDGTGVVWVQPPGSPPPTPITATFAYQGPIDGALSANVRIMGKQAATVGSTSTNSTPPASQPAVTSQGTIVTTPVDNTGIISTGSSSVYINGKKAARNGDKAKTYSYAAGPPGTSALVENAQVIATGTVYMGG